MRRRTLLATIPTFAALSGCNTRKPGASPASDGTTATTTATTPDTTTRRTPTQTDPTETTTQTTKTETTTETTTQTTKTETTTETTTQTTTETTTTTVRDPEYPRFVDVQSVQSTSSPALTFDARIHNERIDATRTASVSATLENTGDTRLKLKMGYRPPFSKVGCEDGGYLLVKPTLDGEFDPCWEPSRPQGEHPLISMKELDPGEVLTTSMKLLGDPKTDACLPTGTFRFVSGFDVTRDGETKGRANAFTIRVSTN